MPYVQRLKPPSLITANHVGYNILSGKGLHEHHWAAPGKRPERIMTPPRKEPFLTAVNRPREFDILNNRFREHHEERQRWEMDRVGNIMLCATAPAPARCARLPSLRRVP